MNASSSAARVVTLNEKEILGDATFLQELRELAAVEGTSEASAREYAAKCLEELAVRPEERYLDRVARLARFMYTRSYEPELDIRVEQLERLTELANDHPMVFLWSHKSHLDSFAFLRAIYDSDFRPQPLSFAGINMAFTGFGTLAKRSGAIFLRRTFRDDAIYKLVFRHYIDYLVGERVPLSWSIEGTRSRTGKLMPPRLGLIQWVVNSYRRASCDDVLFVPVSISFDQIAEMDDYVAMQRGLPKRKESLGWFVGYISGMKAKNGKIYLRFAEPVSLADAAQVSDALFDTAGDPQRVQVQKLAFEVCSRIEHVTPVTITDLVTMVLLAANERALTESQIRAHAREIVALIQKRALPTASDLGMDAGDNLAACLDDMVKSGLLERYDETQHPVYRISPGKQLAAAYYRNTIIHYFLSSAIAEMAAASLDDETRSTDAFWQTVFALRDLLKFEFFFKTKEQFRVDIEWYLHERYPVFAASDNVPTADAFFREHPPLFGHSIMRSFVEAYKILARVLRDKGGYGIADDHVQQLLGECLKHGREMLLRKHIESETAISEPLFATAVKLARYRRLLGGPADELTSRRKAFAADVDTAVHAINRLQRYHDQRQELTCDS